MLDIVNRYAHGFVAVPIILACKNKGLFHLLQRYNAMTLASIAEVMKANPGPLQVALKIMQSLNWLSRNEVGEYSLTADAVSHQEIPEEILDLYNLPVESYLMKDRQGGRLQRWIERSNQRWGVSTLLIADFLDGVLFIPILNALKKNALFDTLDEQQKPLFSELSLPVRQELCELFVGKEWAHLQAGRLCLTPTGQFIVAQVLIAETTADYAPLVSRIPELLFGDYHSVFQKDAIGHESRLTLDLNTLNSRFQDEEYFADLEEIILSIFNSLPYEDQPKYVAHMGCGDGIFLKRVYEIIRFKSLRGSVLDKYPVCTIGVDETERAIDVTARTLTTIPHLVLKGDLGNPEQIVSDLRDRGIDSQAILHIRSFHDHARPYITPLNRPLAKISPTPPQPSPYQGEGANFPRNQGEGANFPRNQGEGANFPRNQGEGANFPRTAGHALSVNLGGMGGNSDFCKRSNLSSLHARSMLPYEGVYINEDGGSIPPPAIVQNLVEHLSRWTCVVNKHDLIILEAHCLSPDVTYKFLDSSESLHFDALQALSMRYLVEADVFLMAAAEASLFPKPQFFKRYPEKHTFSRITLNWFEKRNYTIRHPHLEDIPALVRLEVECWPEHLRASADEIQQRIERFPNGHCVLEMAGGVVGVIYSQRIFSSDALNNTTFREVSSLHTMQGPIIQLLAINVLPERQHQGLGDQLLEFMLQFCALKSGIERVVAVTLCKNYVNYSPIPMEEYIQKRNERGQLLDPILGFHEYHGATIKKIIPGYRPSDVDNQGKGVLIEYDIHNRQLNCSRSSNQPDPLPEIKEHETLSSLVEESVRSVIGRQRMTAFSAKRPLMEIGLDSLDLLTLRSLLSQRLGVDLDTTFFFQYSTPEAIARYFEGNLSTNREEIHKSSPSIASNATPQVDGKNILSHEQVVQLTNAASNMESPSPRSGDANTEREYSSEKSEVRTDSEDFVAIIGMGCRFPGGVTNSEEYWSLLRQGIDAIAKVPKTRWDIDLYYDSKGAQPGKISTQYGGFLDRVDQFDAEFFSIAPKEANFIDPQQRILLEVTWEALENAGLNPETLSETQTGVFVGIFSHDYELLQVRQKENKDYEAYFATGNSASVAAGRLSYFFGFNGPAISVDTACSSSLVSVHLACQSLQSKECDLAIASGVNLLLAPDLSVTFSQSGMLAQDGRCKTFDASANGYVRSEGCGVVVLKRLSQALADKDNILAVLRGTAINQDGFSNGLTAPNGLSQEAVIRKALSSSGVSPNQVSYVETHGTGTSLGDPIEVKALEAVYGQGRVKDDPLVIGSVKTNIGHTEAVAGIAGLIKVILSMQNEYIPRHLHFKELNPNITLNRIPAIIPTAGMEWKRNDLGKRRLAGVSSFGFSGTNAHVIVEEPPLSGVVKAVAVERPKHLLTLSAKSENALRSLAKRYEDFLVSHRETSLADVCFTANMGRTHFDHRLAAIAESTVQLREQLGAFAKRGETAFVVSGQVNGKSPKIAFLFTGQGSQYIGMGHQLYETQPTFRASLDRCDEILRPYLEKPLLNVLYPQPGETSPIDETAYTQPVLFALEYALAELWHSWGIIPQVVMGHSVGEYVAACVAGVFSLEDGLKLIAARGRLMQALPQDGEMVAVFASFATVAAAIEPYAESVAFAAFNGSQNIVISGKCDNIRRVVATLEAAAIKTVKLNVSHAFHSPLMEPMLADFEQVAKDVTYSPPRIDLISNITGQLVTPEIATPEYWIRHIRQPVRFATSIETLHQQGYGVFVEIGAKPILLGMGRRCLPEGVGVWLPSLRQGDSDWQQILQSLGALYVRGIPVDWSGFDQDYPRRRVMLPTYPFQRQRYWVEADPGKRDAPVLSRKDSQNPILNLLRQGDIEQLAQKLEIVEQLSEDEVKSQLNALKITQLRRGRVSE